MASNSDFADTLHANDMDIFSDLAADNYSFHNMNMAKDQIFHPKTYHCMFYGCTIPSSRNSQDCVF